MSDYARMADNASMFTNAQPNDSVSVAGAAAGHSSGLSKPRRVVWLKRLAVLQLLLAIALLIIGSSCFLYSHLSGRPRTCFVGFGGWSSILYIVCSGLGIGATFSLPRRRCLLTSYFVLLIIGSVLNAILLLLSTVYLIEASNRFVWHPTDYRDYHHYEPHHYASNKTTTTTTISPSELRAYDRRVRARDAAIVFNSLIVIMALVHFVSTVVSASLVCSYWSKGGCCGGPDEPEPTVLYIAPPDGSSAQPQIIVLPKKIDSRQPITIQLQPSASSAPPTEEFLPKPPK